MGGNLFRPAESVGGIKGVEIDMRRLIVPVLLLALATGVSGCVYDGGHGWCWYHPHKCP